MKIVTAARTVFFISLILIASAATTPRDIPMTESVNDKVLHTLAFFTLSFLGKISFSRRSLLMPLLLFIYGVLIEIIQFFLPYRTFSLADIAADIAGIALFFLLQNLALRYISRRE